MTDTSTADVLALGPNSVEEPGHVGTSVSGKPDILNTEATNPVAWENSLAIPPDVPLLWSATAAASIPASTGATRSHHTKQKLDENGVKRPPRPPNAWILYRSDCIQKQRAARPPGAPKPTQAELSKLFGEQWRNESDETRGGYERLAEAAREEHAQKYPDWRFSRKPIKQAMLNDGQASSISPQVKPVRLQVPSENDQTRKRSRNASGASSDDTSSYVTPPDFRSNGVPNGDARLGQVSQTVQASSLNAFNDANGKRAHTTSSGLGRPASQESFSFGYDKINSGEYAQPLHSPYRTFPQREGLNATLAQRNTSAAQFYNMYDVSPRSAALHMRPDSSHAPDSGSSSSFPHSFEFNGPGSAGSENSHLAFYINDSALPFDQPQLSLPSMPFGMATHENSFAQPQAGNDSSRWSPSHNSAQPPPSHAPAIDPSLQESIGLDCPEWLYALRHVKVRPDDLSGVPLLDLLGDLHTRHTRPPTAEVLQMPMSYPQYSFP